MWVSGAPRGSMFGASLGRAQGNGSRRESRGTKAFRKAFRKGSKSRCAQGSGRPGPPCWHSFQTFPTALLPPQPSSSLGAQPQPEWPPHHLHPRIPGSGQRARNSIGATSSHLESQESRYPNPGDVSGEQKQVQARALLLLGGGAGVEGRLLWLGANAPWCSASPWRMPWEGSL